MSTRLKAVLVVLPIVVLLIVLLVSGVGAAAPPAGKGVTHTIYKIYDTSQGWIYYNAVFHNRTEKLTVTVAVYPQSGPLKIK